jgi:hypothetical protein
MSDSDSDVSFEGLEAALSSSQFKGNASPGNARAASAAKPAPPRAEERSRTLSDFSDDDVAKQDLRAWSNVDAGQLESSALQLVQSIVATAPTDESIRDVAWQPLPQFLVAQEPVDPLGMGRLDLEHMRLVRHLGAAPARPGGPAGQLLDARAAAAACRTGAACAAAALQRRPAGRPVCWPAGQAQASSLAPALCAGGPAHAPDVPAMRRLPQEGRAGGPSSSREDSLAVRCRPPLARGLSSPAGSSSAAHCRPAAGQRWPAASCAPPCLCVPGR